MVTSKIFPHVSRELLRELKERFPDTLPSGKPDLRDVDQRIGNQQVIRLLEQHHEEQHKAALTGA